jgi:hypothetical protein
LNADRNELLTLLSSAAPARDAEFVETRALIRRAGTLEKARRWLAVFEQFLPPDAEEPLLSYLRYGLLGLCLGFVERELSPYVAEHLAIVPPMLEDIRAVHEKLEELGLRPDPEAFRYRAFDYGVHKAYYLDWTLYMSKECY